MQPEITLGVPASLLRNRPDVIAAEYNLITNFEINVAKSGFYPFKSHCDWRISVLI
jgi:outer membrane protein TolC